jgi:hypothetical protein
MKTVDDYITDPRILDDKSLMEGPREIREIHAIRLKQLDETAGMTSAEENDYYNRKARHLFADAGDVPQCVNLSGQGKLKPRAPETVGK